MFVIITKNGYVGKERIVDELRDDLPFAFAYTYADRNVADDIAIYMNGTVRAI